MKIKVGTRGSKLALAQTNYVIDRLRQAFPENEYEVVIIKTTGDIDQVRPLDQIGSKGLFVDEIERALLADEIQLAVHSMKDMPSEQPKGLIFAKAWLREDPRDVLILKNGNKLSDLPEGANVATGSKRRSFQLLALRPDLHIFPIRGNIDTRIKKLNEGLADGTELDGIVLAAAGLKRLGLEDRISRYFSPEEMIPAACQGILGIQTRAGAESELIAKINDKDSKRCALAERAYVKAIGADCGSPDTAFAQISGDQIMIMGLRYDPERKIVVRDSICGAASDAETLSRELADRIMRNER